MGRPRTRLRLARAFLPAFALALAVVILALLAQGQGAAAAGGATVNIEIGDNFFNPKNATVNVGDTVVWTNKGRVAHDVTANNGAFVSPRNLAPGATFSYTATTAGTFAYICTIHAGHDGTLTVQAAAAPSAAPSASTSGVPAAAPRTGGGGMASVSLQPWQQLAALATLAFAAAGLLLTRRIRRLG